MTDNYSGGFEKLSRLHTQSFTYQLADAEGNLSHEYTFTLGKKYGTEYIGTANPEYLDLASLDNYYQDEYYRLGYGSDHSRKIMMGGGDDTVIASWGNDVIYGGDGNDFIDAVGIIHGDTGNDTLIAGSLQQYVNSNYTDGWIFQQIAEQTELYGGDGDDHLSGNATIMNGGNGNDTLTISGVLLVSNYETMSYKGETLADGGHGDDTYIIKHQGIGYEVTAHHSITDVAGNDTLRLDLDTSWGTLKTTVNDNGSWTISYFQDPEIFYMSYMDNVIVNVSGQIETFIMPGGKHYTAAEFLSLTQNGLEGQNYIDYRAHQVGKVAAALATDLGSDTVSTESADIAAGYTAQANAGKISSLTASDTADNNGLLLNDTAADTLEAGVNSVTTTIASQAGVADSVAYAAIDSISLVDDNANVAAVI